jgi:hypothetical protein
MPHGLGFQKRDFGPLLRRCQRRGEPGIPPADDRQIDASLTLKAGRIRGAYRGLAP